ncbi:hypothetical protein U9M48_035151 [Paspalum notatum var. saurae]|uniref:Rx N-terminal domain-containing protein n=1 Tax=Paspalum notatum var. saurae TaxID=547442 RepID=A0AAQ3UCG8_PASNO
MSRLMPPQRCPAPPLHWVTATAELPASVWPPCLGPHHCSGYHRWSSATQRLASAELWRPPLPTMRREKCSHQGSKNGDAIFCCYGAVQASKVESLQKVERALLRIAITVEEAEGRLITNKAMLQQLKMLREELHKGHYVLDKFRYLDDREEVKVDVHHQSRSIARFISNPGKHFPPPTARSRQGKRELKLALDCVQSMATDMYELVAFLKNYPLMCRQPYSIYLYFETCMFGRQVEMEQTISFLLQRQLPGGEFDLDVLPIVGKGKVGKSTLVEHVCHDIRVRDRFSQILFFRGNKFIEKTLGTLKDGDAIKHKNKSQNDREMLVILELDGGC